MNYFFGVVFLLGGAAMTWFRREFIGQLRLMMVTSGRRDPGDGYIRKIEWITVGLGLTCGLAGLLMLAGVLDLSSG